MRGIVGQRGFGGGGLHLLYVPHAGKGGKNLHVGEGRAAKDNDVGAAQNNAFQIFCNLVFLHLIQCLYRYHHGHAELPEQGEVLFQ